MSMDARDFTQAPPAYLPVPWVLRMRERLRNFQATGEMEWYRVEKGNRDWSPAKTPGRSAPEGAANINGGN